MASNMPINSALLQAQILQASTKAGTEVVSKEMAGLKTDMKKETHVSDPQDSVALTIPETVTTEEQLTAAEFSGNTSQLERDNRTRPDGERLEEGRERAMMASHEGHREIAPDVGGSVEQPVQVEGVAEVSRERGLTDQEKIHGILHDVPEDVKRVSGEMVTNQIDGTKAAQSLVKVHNLPEPAQMQMEAEGFHAESLDIHDTGNGPLLHEGTPVAFEEHQFEGNPADISDLRKVASALAQATKSNGGIFPYDKNAMQQKEYPVTIDGEVLPLKCENVDGIASLYLGVYDGTNRQKDMRYANNPKFIQSGPQGIGHYRTSWNSKESVVRMPNSVEASIDRLQFGNAQCLMVTIPQESLPDFLGWGQNIPSH